MDIRRPIPAVRRTMSIVVMWFRRPITVIDLVMGIVGTAAVLGDMGGVIIDVNGTFC
jgi:hypothetical protein